MAVKVLMKSGHLSALAVALAAMAMPSLAQAQRFEERSEARSEAQIEARAEARMERPARAESQGGWGGHPQAQPVQQAAPQARWNGDIPGEVDVGGRRSRGDSNDGNRGWRGTTPPSAPTAVPAHRGSWGNDRRDSDSHDRRDGYRRDRRDGYRDGHRDGHRDGGWNGNSDWRNGWSSRYGQHHRRWDNHSWRRDNRYDWNRYRSHNRSIFRLGSYYSPYRNYSYRRLSIGFFLDSLFYTNRYRINDPWQYRLPEVHGPYRWVRYYDDVLLVDIYTGEVVDTIYGFFW